MYKIQYTKFPTKVEPHYEIIFSYMLGDADGDTTETISFNEKDFTEEIQEHLHTIQKYSKIKISGYWSNGFGKGMFKSALEQKLITEEEYNILCDERYSKSFFTNIIFEEYGYTFASIRNVEIFYYDVDGCKYKVNWED